MTPPAAQLASFSSRRYERGLRFVQRLYLPRTLGLALGGIAVGAVLHTNGASPLLWIALAFTALAWPHLAYWLARGSGDPYRAELRNLTADSAMGGAWIALMQFNLLPSVLLFVMLSMDKLTVGGPRFLARCTVALLSACFLAGWLTGFRASPATHLNEIVASLPLLVAYPLAVAMATYNMARQLQYQNRQLETLSRTDGVSRMLTRQAWEEAVGDELIVCRRSGLPAALLLVSVDRLRIINEWHSYPAGDEVIRSVAAILRHALREQDVPGRHGGDRFGALLRNTGAAEAAALAERVRERVEASVLERSATVRGTVSIGIAGFDAADADYREWIARADRALQAAKSGGGNRVERAGAAATA